MRTQPNELGGTTTTLVLGDDLNALPAELLPSLTPELVRVYRDPIGWIAGIAQQTKRDSFKKLLRQFIDCNQWELSIVDPNFPYPYIVSGIKFFRDKKSPCFLHPQFEENYSGLLPDIFAEILWINWGGLSCAGELKAENQWDHFLAMDDLPCRHPSFSDPSTRTFANSPCGDDMICNTDGIAGYVSHEDGSAYEFGPLSDMVDWALNSLAIGQWPDFDYHHAANE